MKAEYFYIIKLDLIIIRIKLSILLPFEFLELIDRHGNVHVYGEH